MTTYDVTVSREDELWVADVAGMTAATDVLRFGDLDIDVRDLIAGLTDADPDGFEIRWHHRAGDDDVAMDGRLRYAEVRPYVVPDALSDLAGPMTGVVELPTHLAWSGLREYDLGDDRKLGLLYETVIRESVDVADVVRYLNGTVLMRVWRRLWLPMRARRVWEQRFWDVGSGRVVDGCSARTRDAGWPSGY